MVKKKTPTKRKTRSDKKTFSDQDIEKIKTMSGFGMPITQIAAVLNCSKSTFERRQREDERVNEALLNGRAQASAKVRQTAFAMATSGKCPALTIFWLKTREGFVENREDDDKKVEFTLNYNFEDKIDV